MRIARMCYWVFLLIAAGGALHAQDWRIIAGFQREQVMPGGKTWVPPEADYIWAKEKKFNVVHCNWANDYFEHFGCITKDSSKWLDEECTSGFSNLMADVQNYLNLAEAKGLNVVFNLEGFLKAHPYNTSELYDPLNFPGAAIEFVNRVKSHPATLGYITFDEPSWRKALADSDPALAQYNDIDYEDQVAFYNIVKNADPNHPVMVTEPVGVCGEPNYPAGNDPPYEPFGYCDKFMNNFSNGQAFDVLALTLTPAWSGCANDQMECMLQYFEDKIGGFYAAWAPDYPVAPVLFAAFDPSLQCDDPQQADPIHCPSPETIEAKWRAGYRSSLEADQCMESFAFFMWAGSSIGMAYQSTYRGLWGGFRTGFGEEGSQWLQQDVANFSGLYDLSAPWCPICATLAINPATLPEAYEGQFYQSQLSASPSHPPFRWILKGGALPNGLSLYDTSGIIGGIPQSFGLFRFTTMVLDGQFKSCTGSREYLLASCPQGALLMDVDSPLYGRVGEAFYQPIGVYCAGDPGSVTYAATGLPPGLAIVGNAIQGIPTQQGYYPVDITVTDGGGKSGSKSLEIIVFGAGKALLVIPEAGTTAGGTEVRIYSYAEAIRQDSTVRFGVRSGSGAPVGSAAAESGQFVSGHLLTAVTPRLPEGYADVTVSTPTQGSVTCAGCYRFATLAYTANQVSQDISVLDTAMDQPFDGDPYSAGLNTLQFPAPTIPMGMAFAKGDKPARELLVVDYNSGNLKIADAANFSFTDEVVLQEPQIFHDDPGAFDVAVGEDGQYAYVAHLTPGTIHPLLPPPYVWNPIGSVSVVKLRTDQHNWPYLVDIDGNPATTTYGAPTGKTRIEPPLDWLFVPLSIEDVAVFKPVIWYQVGDKWPGEYLFLSGVGPAEWTWIIPKCEPFKICPPIHILLPRPIEVAVVDLNPHIVTGLVLRNGVMVPLLGPNPSYRRFIKKIPIGAGGEFPSDQGLSFHVLQQGRDMTAHIYAVNPAQNLAAVIDFNTLDTVKDAAGNPILIPTGSIPTDVKVQSVPFPSPTGEKTIVYIANAGDDSVTALDAATYAEIAGSPILMDSCQDADHYPTSIETRTSGERAYASNLYSNSVSVFNLVSTTLGSPTCEMASGAAPIRIAVQPVVTLEDAGRAIPRDLSYADPVEEFTEPVKQPVLVNDWDHVQELEETNASPQAVLSNLDNFQKNANKWIRGETLKTKLNSSVDLYRLIYKAEHWDELPPNLK